MAENKRPLIAANSPPRINFATIKKQRTITKNSNNNMLKSPMAGDRNYNAGGVTTEGDRLSVLVDTTRMQLISPPPEEMLRKNPRPSVQFTPSLLANTSTSPVKSSTHGTTAAKRKRTQPAPAPSTPSSSKGVDSMNEDSVSAIQSPQVVEATPNPKPRKQGRLHSRQPSLESPTRTTFGYLGSSPVSNDGIPKQHTPSKPKMKLGIKPSRRSATPIPPYEPPMDVFTPPREVFLSPALPKSMSKSSKRKTMPSASASKSAKSKKKVPTLTIVTRVKQELPDIDLSLPMPPASPTDDPLLLSGPPEPEFDSEPTPPRGQEISMMHLNSDDVGISPVRLFDPNDVPPSPNGGWSDSEDEGGQGSVVATGGMDEGEGEYTGHWKMMLVRTKQDPPSSVTRGRMEEWGRPISPFPKKVQRLSFLEEREEDEQVHQEEDHQQVGGQQEGCQQEGSQQEDEDMTREEEELEEEEEVRQMSIEPEQLLEYVPESADVSLDAEHMTREEEELEEEEVRQMSIEPEQLLEYVPESADVSLDAEHTRDARDLELFDKDRTEPIIPSDVQHSPHELLPDIQQQQEEQGRDDDQSSDDDDELSLVKITSADPRAAARAAAILKQHDYDCYTKIEAKRRHLEAKHRRNSLSDIGDFAKESRRRDISSSGVAKASNSRRRRSTLGMGVIGDRVFIPGTPAITLPELLQEAELEVRDSPQSLSQIAGRRGEDLFKTPLRAKYGGQTANTPMSSQAEVYSNAIGEREWTKEDWKCLDACFTDQRLEVGSRLAGAEEDLLAPVDMVSINDVVDRFVLSKGGFETVTMFGALWSRENLLERTRALQRKQRSGHIAAPSMPCTPLSCTPLSVGSNSIIPPTLLAPRYSHLLEEAISISQQVTALSPVRNDLSQSDPEATTIDQHEETQDSFSQSEIEDTPPHPSDIPSTTIGKRVKGFLFSYLPTLSSKPSSATRKAPKPLQPGLPLPPIDILTKPRGPVVTPARAPLPKPKHPKELVVLHPAPQPPTVSHIPRMIKPRRLVELHPPPPPVVEPTPIPRPRRSSGSSVKDLVRGFEELQTLAHDNKLKRTKSNDGGKRAADRRPQWKP